MTLPPPGGLGFSTSASPTSRAYLQYWQAMTSEPQEQELATE